MTTIHLFAGQGSQRVGMGRDLLAAYPNLVRQADAVLGYSVAELCLEGPAERLGDTRFTQCAVYVVDALSYVDTVRTTGVIPDLVAGHSLGEYAALFAAGAYDFRTGLEIVARRAVLMAEAGPGAMAAVVGLDEARVRRILEESGAVLDIANLNAPDQIVLSGPAEALRAITPMLSEQADAVIPLPVSGAFHSRWMAPAAREFERFLRGFVLARLKIPVIANTTGRPYDGDIARTLVRQLTEPVRWSDTVVHCLDQPDPQLHEIGPGTVLTGLTRRIRAARREPVGL
ncbi:ACP S-malonyltransferase [Streptomyces sp. NBC_01439]|uniref:ACP S-malonyltransferase n=1 Tax=Streptomyces sp. NBC_01439 TaxID=2903867 RepID=UPI002E2D9FEB|nr:ACP S-malonyltransferase [Streptomyces sp. NBC_01439]